MNIIKKITLFCIYLMIFTIPFEEASFTGSLFSFSKLAGVAAIGLGVMQVIIRLKMRKLPFVFVSIYLFFLWALASYLWTIHKPLTKELLVTLIQLMFMTWLIWEYVVEQEDIHKIFTAYILGCMVSIIGTIMAFLTNTTSNGRYVIAGYDENILCLLLSVSIPMAWYLVVKSEKKWQKITFLAYIPLNLFAILLTGSRGGMLTAMMASSYIFFNLNKAPSWIRTLIIANSILLLPIIVIKFLPKEILTRLLSTTKEIKSGSMSDRKYIWQAGQKILKNNYIFGVGLNAYQHGVYPILGYAKVAHNTFLSLLVELGIPGFTLFFGNIAILIIRALFLPFLERTLVWLMFMAWAISVSALTFEITKITWFLIGITCVICFKPRDNEREEQKSINEQASV